MEKITLKMKEYKKLIEESEDLLFDNERIETLKNARKSIEKVAGLY